MFLDAGERQLARVRCLSIGIMSAAQGQYSRAQLLLDLTQGARVSTSSYAAPTPQPLSLSLDTGGAGATNGTGSTGAAGKTGGTGNTGGAGGGFVSGWAAARRRAEDAPQLLQPGLLAAHVPGGAGYAGIEGDGAGDAGSHVDGVLAAGREGRLAAVSLGRSSTLLARVAGLRARERLVVADLPAGGAGLADLRSLCAARARGELLVAIERTSDARAGALLWSAVAGLRGGGGRELSSQSTRERGVIASFDLAPTILARLGVRIPADVRGKPIETDGVLHGASLRALMARLRVIGPRRLKALAFLLLAWAALLLGGALYRGGRSARGARRARARAWALRTGALGVLWSPAVALLPAWLEPSAAVEYALLALVCLALGALTDVLLAWPRAPLAPALVTLAAFVFDALAGTQLLMRSLLGPDPILGARFYGIGNELKSGLAVLVAAALAGALYPAVRSRRAALAMALAGVLLALVEGSARIGAGVGGVVLVAFGFAVATALLAPGALTRRRALAVLVSPVAALVALAALDLATARGAGHFTGSVLHARSAGDVRDIVVRRYRAAFAELHNHAMPLASALALASGVWALVRRERLLAPVGGDPAWGAALAGGLAAGVVGSLVEDSGPELLVVAVFALGCVVCYLWGRPRVSRAHEAGRLELRADATDGSRA